MLRRWALFLALALLASAGLAFALLGFRALRLERVEGARRARDRTDRALLVAAARAPELAETPREPPAAAWRVFEPQGETPPGEATSEDLLLLREAAHVERARGDAREALRLLGSLVRPDTPDPLLRLVALRAGALARRLGETDQARRWLEVAAAAPEAARTPEGPGVRASALYHLVAMNEGPGTERIDEFLRLTEEGRAITPPGRPGPDDLLVALADAIRDADRPIADSGRLTEAAARARRGQDLLRVVTGPGVVVVEGRVVRRAGERLEERALDSLLDPAVTEVPIAARRPGDPVPDGATVRRLGAPLDSVILVAAPPGAERGGSPSALGLLTGLVLYGAGILTTVLALRRSARTSRMQESFVAAVSHELKTPITSVRAMAELLADGGAEDPTRTQEYAERIGREMERLGTTVRNVLDTARIERTGGVPVTLVPGDPAAVVRETGEDLRGPLEHAGFRLHIEVDAADEPLPLDRAALEGVLRNLVDNAAKFSPDERSIEITAGPRPDAAGYRIAIRDRGIGLPPRDRRRIFDRFVRGDAARERAVPGVGLGLHVCRQVVEAHGGVIRAEPREGGGSVFVIDLPRGTT